LNLLNPGLSRQKQDSVRKSLFLTANRTYILGTS